MSSPQIDAPDIPLKKPVGASWLELLLASIGLTVLVVLTTQFFGGRDLLSRPMWVDEYLTHLIVTQPDWAHVLEPFKAGPEHNLPAYHVIVRLATQAMGHVSAPTNYRVVSLGFALLTLICVYTLLRRSVDALSAAIAVVCLWGLPSYIDFAFEGRFYALLTALNASVALLVNTRRLNPRGWNALLLFTVSALCVWSHWFGVLGVVSIGFGAAVLQRRAGWPALMRLLWPLALGAGTFVLAYPLYRSQHAGSGSVSWITPNYIQSTYGTLVSLYASAGLALVALVASIHVAVRRRSIEAASRDPVDPWPLVLLASPALIIVGLLVVSMALQPMMVMRYAAPAMLAVTSPVALLAVGLPRSLKIGLLILLIALSAGRMDAKREYEAERFAPMHFEVVAAIRDAHVDWPIVTTSTHLAAPLEQFLPEKLRPLIWFVSDDTLDAGSRLYASERLMNVMSQKLLIFPRRIIPVQSLESEPHFWLLGDTATAKHLAARLSSHEFTLRAPGLYEVHARHP